MIFAFSCQNTYEDAEFHSHPDMPYPVPPKLYDPEVGARSFQNHLEMARYADDKFDWISFSEHHAWPILQIPNAAVLLAAASSVCKKAKLAWMGPLVSINNPIRIAEEAAMLDQMTNGRLICLFLRGTPNEFIVYDVRADETRARTQEAVHLIRKALTEPYPFSWQGRHYRYRNVAVWPTATQKPLFPILSSGNSLESATFAAKNRQGLAISFFPPEMVRDLVAFYKEECRRFGWEANPDWILYRAFASVGETDAEGEERAARYYGQSLGLFGSFTGRGSHMAGDVHAPEPPKRYDSDQKDTGVAGFAVGQLAFKGSAETVAQQVRAFTRMTGVGIIDVAFNGGGLTAEESFDALRRFGDQVIPRVRELVAFDSKQEVARVSQ